MVNSQWPRTRQSLPMITSREINRVICYYHSCSTVRSSAYLAMPNTSGTPSKESSHARPLRDREQQDTPTHRRILSVHNEVASDGQHSARHLHLIQPVHIPRTHLRGTSAHAPQPTRGDTTPLRNIDPPTPRHSVADSHAAATSEHGGRTGGPHPTTTSFWAYGLISHTKA